MPYLIRQLYLVTLLLTGMTATSARAQQAVTVTDPSGHGAALTLQELQVLPGSEATLGENRHVAGPTLWAVLDRSGAIDPNFHKRVNQTIVATGRDGYSATLAMGEIDPEFEHKAVLLAIDPERHTLRLAVPGDKRLGRDVRGRGEPDGAVRSGGWGVVGLDGREVAGEKLGLDRRELAGAALGEAGGADVASQHVGIAVHAQGLLVLRV